MKAREDMSDHNFCQIIKNNFIIIVQCRLRIEGWLPWTAIRLFLDLMIKNKLYVLRGCLSREIFGRKQTVNTFSLKD
jgi:hypothetical protein